LGISNLDEIRETLLALERVIVLLVEFVVVVSGSEEESNPVAWAARSPSGVLLLSSLFWLVSFGGVEANLLYLFILFEECFRFYFSILSFPRLTVFVVEL